VCDASLVKYIRITFRAVANNNARTVDQVDDILNDGGRLPNVVGASASHFSVGRCPLNGFKHRRELRRRWPRYGGKFVLNFLALFDGENYRSLAAWSDQKYHVSL
jgi:hypothetical protein